MTAYTTILRCLVGSQVHGTNIAGTDDRDEMGICVEDPRHFFGLRPRFEQHVERSKPEGVRSGPGDLDRTTFSLAKWCRLALAGNPTILLPLFVPASAIEDMTEAGFALRAMAPAFIGKSLFAPYLGYMRQQRRRLVTNKDKPNRPELVAAYGFDTKYAGHVLRLGFQGVELASHSRLTLPMPPGERERVLSVRRGEVSLPDVLAQAEDLERELESLQVGYTREVDRDRVERFVVRLYAERLAALVA